MVYFISDKSDYIKIGSTNNLEKRLGGGLQTGNPNQLYVVIEIHCDNYIQLEIALHKHFHKYRKIGEWFNKCVVNEFLDMTEIQLRQLVRNYDLGDILIKTSNNSVVFKNKHNENRADKIIQNKPKITSYWKVDKNGERSCGYCGIPISSNINIRFFNFCPYCGNDMRAV